MPSAHMLFWLTAGLLAGVWYVWFAAKGHPARERKAYANGLVIAAVIYVVFALVHLDVAWLSIEILGVFAFGAFVWLGRRFSFYLVAIGWLLHPIWDAGLHWRGKGSLIVPSWYVIACISFDVVLAVVVAYRVFRWRKEE